MEDSPDLIGVQVHITNARRAFRIADHYGRRGAFGVLGGLHVTSCPGEAAQHADALVLGPGEEAWPRFLADFRAGRPARRYQSRHRALRGAPPPRRDLIRRHLCLVPNSLVVSRGCPHRCNFCYKHGLFDGGRGYYTQQVDAALAEIDRLPGRHLYFLDDHLFGGRDFASALFAGMRGMGRLWQAAATVGSILETRAHPRLVEEAAGWKKFEPLWDLVLRAKRVSSITPLLESIPSAGDPRPPGQSDDRTERVPAPANRPATGG